MIKITAGIAAALAATTFAIATPAIAAANTDTGSRTTVSANAAGSRGTARNSTGNAAATPKPAAASYPDTTDFKIAYINAKLANLGNKLPH